jgi:hypothetical protein
MEQTAKGIILSACRGRKFVTRGTWGMRTDVLLGGYGTNERTPCAVLDLERTKPHATKAGFYEPIVLASGDTWENVLAALVARGEIEVSP